jgi:uncharacterized phage-associated protein
MTNKKKGQTGVANTTVYDVITVADEVLRIAKEKNIELSPMKLTKLTYITHGWYLAIIGKDLFRNRIEAWKYGPVIPDLYHATKEFGRNIIPFNQIESENDNVDQSTSDFIEEVVSKYGSLSAVQLSSLTHQSGTPWDMVYREGKMGIEIPDTLIKDHYKNLLNVQ